MEQAEARKEIAREILKDATFELHKWSSNVLQLEVDEVHQDPELSVEQSYTKSQLLVKPKETKVLGLKWDKQSDTLKVSFPLGDVPATKRGILSKLAKIYDPLGLVSPLTLEGKLLFRVVCDAKLPWDTEINCEQLKRWRVWERSLPVEEEVPRLDAKYEEPIDEIELHSFGDASTKGVGKIFIGVMSQRRRTPRTLLAEAVLCLLRSGGRGQNGLMI